MGFSVPPMWPSKEAEILLSARSRPPGDFTLCTVHVGSLCTEGFAEREAQTQATRCEAGDLGDDTGAHTHICARRMAEKELQNGQVRMEGH